MQLRNDNHKNLFISSIREIIEKHHKNGAGDSDDLVILFYLMKQVASHIMTTGDFDKEIVTLLQDAEKLLPITLSNLLLHICNDIKQDYSTNIIIRFMHEFPDFSKSTYIGTFANINNHLKAKKDSDGIQIYRENVIRILAAIIHLESSDQELQINLINTFLSGLEPDAAKNDILEEAMSRCITDAAKNKDYNTVKSLSELGHRFGFNTGDNLAVKQLLIQLKASIENHDDHRFDETLNELLSTRYQSIFNINSPIDASGATALTAAISSVNISAIRHLLDAGADKEQVDINKLNESLLTSIRTGDTHLFDQLIELGTDPRHRIENTGISTLHIAAMQGHLYIIEKLLALNVSPLNHDCHGDSPLSIAVKRNDLNAVKFFIDYIIDKSYPADQLLKFLMFNQHLEYLLVSAQRPGILYEICRLVEYLVKKGIPHNEIRKLRQGPLVSAYLHPFMKDHEHDNYYAALLKNQLTTYHNFLADYYQKKAQSTLITMAIDSQNLMTIKMLLAMGSALSDADVVKLNNNIELLRELDTDFPVVVDTLLESEIKKLPQYAKNNDINNVNRILNLIRINPKKRHAALINHLSNQHVFRDALVAAKDRRLCILLLDYIGLIESHKHIDLKDFLPEKYIFANYNLKEDIFTAIKAKPLAARIEKYNLILNDKDSVFYHIFHMKRGYIWGVNEKRGILHDVREAYYNDMNLNKRLLTATKDNDLKAMQACIKQGADVNYCDVNISCSNALNIAAAYGYRDAAKLLLDNGADINVILSHENPLSRVTPLYSSITQDHPEMVELLLSRHANANIAVEYDQCTPLMNAASKGDVRMMIALLTHDAKIDTFGNEHLSFASPLTYVLRDRQHEILGLMVDHMIKYYDIERIVKFLQSHDNLKNCFKQAGENQKLLAPLQNLLRHLAANNVPCDVFEAHLPETMKTSKKKVETTAETTTTGMYPKLIPGSAEKSEKQPEAATETTPAVLYPKIRQESVQHSEAMQQYLDKGRQLRTEATTPAYVVENPLTDTPLPQAPAAAVSDPFAAIDTILMAPAVPSKPSWIEDLNEIDFSQTEPSSTAVIMNQLGDLMSFEEPAKPDVNTFDGLVEQEKQPVAAKPGYTNPFDDVTDEQHDDHVAAQLAALPKAPTHGTLFAANHQSNNQPTLQIKKALAL